MGEKQYTQKELDDLIAERDEGFNTRVQDILEAAAAHEKRVITQAFLEGRKAQAKIIDEAKAEGYRTAIVDGVEIKRCGAASPEVTLRGEPVYCQREEGHKLGRFERHKAVDNLEQPHQAFIWE